MRVGLCLLCRSWLGQQGPLGDGICRDTLARGLRPKPGVGVLSPKELSAEVKCQTRMDWIDADPGLSGHPEIPLFLPTQWL